MNNESKENNTIKLKKDVVKNIAIVFLSIMLILTFFSNSIMNKSLPEVATQYIQSQTITEKIRGTGVVEADDPYSVMVKDSRVIHSVAVKEGDTVSKDQVLFYLEEGDSEELDKAQKDLEDLIYKYTAGALSGEMSAQAYNQATTGQVSPMAVYEAQILAAKQRVKTAQENVDSIARQQTVASGSTDSDSDLNQAKLDLEEAQIKMNTAKAKYDELKAIVDAGNSNTTSAQSEKDAAELELANAKAKYETKQDAIVAQINDTSITAFKNAYDNKYSALNSKNEVSELLFYGTDPNKDEKKAINDADALNDWIYATKSTIAEAESEIKDITEAYKAYMGAISDYSSKDAAMEAAKNKYNEYSSAVSKLSSAESDYNSAKNRVDELTTKITRLTNEQSENKAGNQQLINDLAIRKADADLELARAKEDQAQLLLDISKTLDLANQNSIIREQREKVEKLKQDASGAQITSPVDGIVLSVAKKAGETTSASDPVATIQVAGKPMYMKITVSAEQAKKVQVGDTAELQNSWYYSDNMMIRLAKIVNDPNNPAKSRQLVFSVEGEVTNGESLSISVGQRAREYDRVVPNSAIREDNKGKFIYTIEEKGTPFGNRYKAKRIDVEVITSDDNNTAINADVDSWAYVITTSDKPISQGQQVRLSD